MMEYPWRKGEQRRRGPRLVVGRRTWQYSSQGFIFDAGEEGFLVGLIGNFWGGGEER